MTWMQDHELEELRQELVKNYPDIAKAIGISSLKTKLTRPVIRKRLRILGGMLEHERLAARCEHCRRLDDLEQRLEQLGSVP